VSRRPAIVDAAPVVVPPLVVVGCTAMTFFLLFGVHGGQGAVVNLLGQVTAASLCWAGVRRRPRAGLLGAAVVIAIAALLVAGHVAGPSDI
jgi:hypothetical protein